MSLRILLVDEHAGSLYALSRLLKLAGHDVRPARAAAEALRLLESTGPSVAWRCDLLISDIGLPGRAALDLMARVESLYGAPGIATTADDEEPADPAWRAAGFVLRLRKPLRFREVEAAIRFVTANRAAPAEFA